MTDETEALAPNTRDQAAYEYSNQSHYVEFRTFGERLSYETHFKAGWDAAMAVKVAAPDTITVPVDIPGYGEDAVE